MRVVIVYESMYGNTRTVAERIGEGMSGGVSVMPVHDVTPALVDGADLLVAGAPTHVRNLPAPRTRESARARIEAEPGERAEGAGSTAGAGPAAVPALTLEPYATEGGVREWLAAMARARGRAAAAFDTRIDVSPLLSGRASRAIAKGLRHHGYRLVTDPQSFLVDNDSHLLAGEEERARAWGTALQAAMAVSERRHARRA